MANFHYEKSMLDALINGLKRLYNLLAEREIKKELLGKKKDGEDSGEKSKFADEEENKQKQGVIQSLKEIFIIKQKEERNRRLQVNSGLALFKIPSHVFIKYILCCMNLKETCSLCLVSVNFNSMIKSNVFLRHYIKIQEKTSININLKTFKSEMKMPSPKLPGKEGSPVKKPSEPEPHTEEVKAVSEDPEMQLELQKRNKAFLSAKLQESDEKKAVLDNDIKVMRSLLEIEKSAKEAAIAQTSKLEGELNTVRNESEEKERDMRERENSLEKQV